MLTEEVLLVRNDSRPRPLPINKHQFKSRVMQPIYDLSFVRHDDVKVGVLKSLLEVLQNSGQNIGHGWPFVFNLLYDVVTEENVFLGM